MSFLSAPVANPINIDPAILYRYVIPQQGYDSITVDDDADFDFKLTFGSPSTLALTYTGTPPTSPSYRTVTIRLNIATSAVVQTLNLRVLPAGPRQIPNITNVSSLRVAPGALVLLQIATDISADSFTATGLPGGLGVASNGRIFGAAPTTSGFNVITFVARKGAYTFKRYFVLTVGTGGAPTTQPFFRFPDL
jgi:hypothetical protein